MPLLVSLNLLQFKWLRAKKYISSRGNSHILPPPHTASSVTSPKWKANFSRPEFAFQVFSLRSSEKLRMHSAKLTKACLHRRNCFKFEFFIYEGLKKIELGGFSTLCLNSGCRFVSRLIVVNAMKLLQRFQLFIWHLFRSFTQDSFYGDNQIVALTGEFWVWQKSVITCHRSKEWLWKDNCVEWCIT